MVEPHPFLPNLEDETIERMLRQVKASSTADLFSDIPEGLRLKRKLAIPDGQGEAMVRRELHARLGRNKTPPDQLCFLGGGVYPHYIPAAVNSILSRQEFYTAYTPYQPEISQGMLGPLRVPEHDVRPPRDAGLQQLDVGLGLGGGGGREDGVQGKGEAHGPGRERHRAGEARSDQDLRRADGCQAPVGRVRLQDRRGSTSRR